MGIQGLLTFVKPASKSVHLSDLKGKTVAIDSYCWIHKGAFGCAEKLGKGEDTDAYVQYCFKFLDMLRTFKITPIMVFDGQNLPAKRLTEEKRREGRALARKKAAECLKLNKLGEARMNFIKAVDVTPEMALKLIKACRKQNIDCIVAPYEADAQLAFLNLNGIVDFVITEDSDLLVFGCSKVLFKLDLNGNGTLVESDKLFLTMDEKPDTFNIDKFRHMCILSGCDYLESLPGVGLKKGMKFIKANSNTDIYDALPKLPSSINLKNVTVTKEYRDNFMTADATFRHQLIYDPMKREIRPLFDPKECGTNIEFCSNAGDMMDQKTAFQLAIGNLSPDDLKVMDNWNPDRDLSPYAFKPSIWSKSYKKPDKISPNELGSDFEKIPVTKNKNVIIDIKIPLPTEKDLRQNMEREILKEENIVKEIHALYFDENPAKKICLEKTEKTSAETEIKTKVSPILTRNRKNIFIKSRFFAEKTQTVSQDTKEVENTKNPNQNDKISNQNETRTLILEKTEEISCLISQNNHEVPLNDKNQLSKHLSSFESHRNESNEKVLSLNETRRTRFSFKRKLESMESPEIELNGGLSDNGPLQMSTDPLGSVESHRNEIINNMTPLPESKAARLSFKRKLEVSESPEKNSNDLKTKTPLKLLSSDSPVKNSPENLVIDQNDELDEVLTSLSQKENAEKICRSRFFSQEITEDVEIGRLEKVVAFEKNDCQTTQVSQGGKHFSRSKSLDEKLFNLSNQKTVVTAKTTSCRRVGLSKKSTGSKFTVQKNQTKLSMFFKKT